MSQCRTMSELSGARQLPVQIELSWLFSQKKLNSNIQIVSTAERCLLAPQSGAYRRGPLGDHLGISSGPWGMYGASSGSSSGASSEACLSIIWGMSGTSSELFWLLSQRTELTNLQNRSIFNLSWPIMKKLSNWCKNQYQWKLCAIIVKCNCCAE